MVLVFKLANFPRLTAIKSASRTRDLQRVATNSSVIERVPKRSQLNSQILKTFIQLANKNKNLATYHRGVLLDGFHNWRSRVDTLFHS